MVPIAMVPMMDPIQYNIDNMENMYHRVMTERARIMR